MEELDRNQLQALYIEFCDGSVKAQKRLYDQTKGVMYRYVLSKSNFTAQDVEDVMHDIWIKLWKSCKYKRSGIGFDQRWRQIAKTTTIDHWRKRERGKEISYEDAVEIENVSGRDDISTQEYDLLKILKNLPKDQAQAWILKQDGYSNEEIAEITCSKVEAVRSKIRYAKKKIAEKLN